MTRRVDAAVLDARPHRHGGEKANGRLLTL